MSSRDKHKFNNKFTTLAFDIISVLKQEHPKMPLTVFLNFIVIFEPIASL